MKTTKTVMLRRADGMYTLIIATMPEFMYVIKGNFLTRHVHQQQY